MLYGTYRFHCKFTTAALLPTFKGSMLRGAFGRELRRLTCALRRNDCADCLLAANCVYSLIFETGKPVPSGEDKPRAAALPHPYVLTPPPEEKRAYADGDSFEFGITLFGRANDFLPYFVCVFEQLGEAGLRPGAQPGPARFVLERVTSVDEVIYDGNRKVMNRARQPQQLMLSAPPPVPVHSLTVHLLTPLRLKQDNRFQGHLPFSRLARAALRRIATLENAYSTGEPDLDYAGLAKKSAGISITKSSLTWCDLTRFSSRQQTAMLLGGLVGSISYAGELTEFLPLLQYCEATNLGKQTAFGLGQIRVEPQGELDG